MLTVLRIHGDIVCIFCHWLFRFGGRTVYGKKKKNGKYIEYNFIPGSDIFSVFYKSVIVYHVCTKYLEIVMTITLGKQNIFNTLIQNERKRHFVLQQLL